MISNPLAHVTGIAAIGIIFSASRGLIEVGMMTLPPRRPVCRCCDMLCVARLERIDHPQDLIKVAPDIHRIDHGQSNLSLRVDDEDRLHGSCCALMGMDHVIKSRNLAVRIGDNREPDG